MLKFYKILIKLSELLLNIMFVLQIGLMVTVFITAAFWFFDLIGSSAFEFARPFAEGISDFVRLFYHEDIEIGGQYIDGSLLLFDILALVAVFLITKSKFYIYRGIECIEHLIRVCLNEYEEKFNQELRQEAEDRIKQCNNVALLVQFEVKNMYVDYEQVNAKEKENEAFKIFYSALKSLGGCKFAKTDDKMLILMDNFSRVDNLLNFVEMTIDKIRANMKKDKWALISYTAVEVYNQKSDFKSLVYPVLEKIISLHHKNEILCLGNFNLRYQLNSEQIYTLFLKSSYNIMDDCDVYGLVKKN